MEHWEEGYAALQRGYGRHEPSPSRSAAELVDGFESEVAAARAAVHSALAEDTLGDKTGWLKNGRQVGARSSRTSAKRKGGLSSSRSAELGAPNASTVRTLPPKLAEAWGRGPRNEEGLLLDASERNVLCMAMHCPRRGGGGPRVVVGSADHALYEYDVISGRRLRQLYTKQSGHSEWVTCVDYLPDGGVVSGAMDSKVCLWRSSGTTCSNLKGHSASVSAVRAGASGTRVVSSSYDKTLRVWDAKRATEICCLKGHKAPVLGFAWGTEGGGGDFLVSGDRDGVAVLWDLSAGAQARKLSGHRGHVTSLRWCDPDVLRLGGGGGDRGGLVLTGGQDGTVRVWDLRQAKCAHNLPCHPGGAVNGIEYSPGGGGSGSFLATAGADSVIKVWDPTMFIERVRYETHLGTGVHRVDRGAAATGLASKFFIYSLRAVGPWLLSGAENGWLAFHDLRPGAPVNGPVGTCSYALGANMAAVTAIEATRDGTHLVAAGDDGKAMVYAFA